MQSHGKHPYGWCESANILPYGLRDRPLPALDEVSLCADSILRSTSKMQTLIHDMLDITQIETGVDREMEIKPNG